MGHVLVDLELEGTKGKKKLERVLVDTGATFTCVEAQILEEVGAQKLPAKVEVELGNGERVLADSYGAAVEFEGRKVPVIIITFPGAKRVVGVQTLEALGLRVNPVTGKLEFVREKGVAYLYEGLK
jgi:predicted aspartyl protease